MTNEQNEKDDASEAVRATDHGFLCDSPCTRFHINGGYCIEEMRKGVSDLDDAVISTLEAQGWKGLRAKLLAERD